MAYRGLLTFDFGQGYDNNQFQRMETALLALGWTHAETSAFVYDQPQGQQDAQALQQIWQGAALVGRASAAIGGRLSALSFVIQFIDPHLVSKTQFGAWQQQPSHDHFRKQVFPGDTQSGQT